MNAVAIGRIVGLVTPHRAGSRADAHSILSAMTSAQTRIITWLIAERRMSTLGVDGVEGGGCGFTYGRRSPRRRSLHGITDLRRHTARGMVVNSAYQVILVGVSALRGVVVAVFSRRPTTASGRWWG